MPSGPVSLNVEKLFTITMLEVYRGAAEAQIRTAEELIARGIDLREHAMAMLQRATELALEHAEMVDAHEQALIEDIHW